MTKINPVLTRGKLPSLSSYCEHDVKLGERRRRTRNFPLSHGNLTGPAIGDILPASYGEFLIAPQEINPSADAR